MPASAEAAFLDRLRQGYLLHLSGELQHFESVAGRSTPPDAALREDLRARAHKLAGNGATYGLPEISTAGRALEEAIDAGGDAQILPLLGALIAVCRAAGSAPQTAPAGVSGAEAAPAPDLPLAKAAPGRLPRVLIVDDDAQVRAALAVLLEGAAEIAMAEDAETALAMMCETCPDLLLLDDQMPGAMTGLKLQERISVMRALRTVRTVMITASDQSEAVIRALTAGAVDYIVKPINAEEVRTRLRERLNRIAKKVFIVDDDPAISDLLSRKFVSAGYSVEVFGDGMSALAAIRADAPNLVILDRMLPRLDGTTVLQEIRADAALNALPVVMLSARRQERDVLAGLALGATDYVVKPFNPQEMIVRCVRLLEARAADAA
ncbi:response regulator transcription factor [Rhodobacter lacus]|uniref:Response regulator transcription factor n=1 Tax=Rhodobacter lacus TaxID=1641972 RepID=A0ABW5AAH9_9RHOB